MRTLDSIHDFIDLIIAEERAGFFSPERKDAALDYGSMKLFKISLPAFGMNEVTNECLSPFKRPFLVTNANSIGGLVTLPDEYEFLTAVIKNGYDNVRKQPTVEEVDIINDDELGRRLRSQIRPVTVEKPIGQRISVTSAGKLYHQIQFYPQLPTALQINYLKRPAKPVYAYDVAGEDGRTITYKPANSTQLEWKDTDIDFVILEALSYLGVNLDSATLIKYSQMKTQGA